MRSFDLVFKPSPATEIDHDQAAALASSKSAPFLRQRTCWLLFDRKACWLSQSQSQSHCTSQFHNQLQGKRVQFDWESDFGSTHCEFHLQPIKWRHLSVPVQTFAYAHSTIKQEPSLCSVHKGNLCEEMWINSLWPTSVNAKASARLQAPAAEWCLRLGLGLRLRLQQLQPRQRLRLRRRVRLRLRLSCSGLSSSVSVAAS